MSSYPELWPVNPRQFNGLLRRFLKVIKRIEWQTALGDLIMVSTPCSSLTGVKGRIGGLRCAIDGRRGIASGMAASSLLPLPHVDAL